MEVCPLSRGMMLLLAQSLSISLQDGFRFFHFPLPTPPSAHLAVCFPSDTASKTLAEMNFDSCNLY